MSTLAWLTGVELFDDELYLSVHVWLVVFDETSQDFLHTLSKEDKLITSDKLFLVSKRRFLASL